MLILLKTSKAGQHTSNTQIVIVDPTKTSLQLPKPTKVLVTVMTSQWLLKITIKTKAKQEMAQKQERILRSRRRVPI